MLNVPFKKTIAIACIGFLTLISGCAPLIPDNYLGPHTIRTAQKINGKWVAPRVIPISANMLNTPEGRELLAPAMQPQPYRIGAFDTLNIIVWGHPEVSTVSTSAFSLPNAGTSLLNASTPTIPPILVQTDGIIFFPYAGHLKVAGLTINETQEKITQKLSKYIRDPQVTVQIAQYRNRNVYVTGAVGGVLLMHIKDKPLTLFEAITEAGGISTGAADPTHIYVIRGFGSYLQPDIFWLNAQTPQALVIAEQFPLQENDIVYVSSATLTAWTNFLSPITGTLAQYGAIKAGITAK